MFSKQLLKQLGRVKKIPKSRSLYPKAAINRAVHSSSVKLMSISIAEASKLPSDYNEMPNDVIQIMAVDGDSDAKEERLIRNIMCVDGIEWAEAQVKFKEVRFILA